MSYVNIQLTASYPPSWYIILPLTKQNYAPLNKTKQNKTKILLDFFTVIYHQGICHIIIISSVTYMRDLQVQVRISSCLAYFNRLLMSLPISNLTPLESKGHQPTSQLKYHFNHITIYCEHRRLTLSLWAVEGEPFMKVSQVFIFCFCSMWTLSTIRLISPTPTDDFQALRPPWLPG